MASSCASIAGQRIPMRPSVVRYSRGAVIRPAAGCGETQALFDTVGAACHLIPIDFRSICRENIV